MPPANGETMDGVVNCAAGGGKAAVSPPNFVPLWTNMTNANKQLALYTNGHAHIVQIEYSTANGGFWKSKSVEKGSSI